MPTRVICPSGMIGDVRALKVKEADALANQANAKHGTSLEGVLSGCWLQTVDSGIYSFAGQPDWTQVLVCDRFYTLMRIRAATYGEDYEFSIQKCGGCGERYDWELKLSDLPMKPLPEGSKDVFKNGGNRFTAALLDGRKVTFHLQTGAGEIRAGAAARKQVTQKVTASLMARIDEIEGVKAQDRFKAINELDLNEARDLIEQFDEVDGGVDTDVITHCMFCGAENTVALPLDRGFWIPKKKKRAAEETTPTS